MYLKQRTRKYTEDEISDETEEAWEKLVEWMHEIPAPVDEKTGRVCKNHLTIDKEDKAEWIEFYDDLHELLPSMPAMFRGYIPKLVTYSLKFMSLIHLLKCYEKNDLTHRVRKSTVSAALRVTRYCAGQEMKLVASMSKASDPYKAAFAKALISLKHEVKRGKLKLSSIRSKANEFLPQNLELDDKDKRLGTWLREIGLEVTSGAANKTVVIWNDEIISSMVGN